MTAADYFMTALCLYREARGEGNVGMTAVACVVRNRVEKHNSTPYAEVVKKWQFSSITASGDPQLILYPLEVDMIWHTAQLLSQNVLDGSTADITGGATLYYDDSISFPASWNKDHTETTVKLGRLNFFKEI